MTLNNLTSLKIRADSNKPAGINEAETIRKSNIFHPDLKNFKMEPSEVILIIISNRKILLFHSPSN